MSGTKNLFLKKGKTPFIDTLIDIFELFDLKSLTRIADQIEVDRSLPYSWTSGRSKPTFKTLVKLSCVAGEKTKLILDEESGLYKDKYWWFKKVISLRDRSLTEVQIETLIKETNFVLVNIPEEDTLPQNQKLNLRKAFLCEIGDASADISVFEYIPDIADYIIGVNLTKEHLGQKIASWRSENRGKISYLFAGNQISISTLYELLHVFAHIPNSKQTIALFVASDSVLQPEEFDLQKAFYQIYLKKLGTVIHNRIKVYLLNSPVSCPVSMSTIDYGNGLMAHSELHGSEKATKAINSLFASKGLKREEVCDKAYNLTTLTTEMSEGVAKTLLQANGIDSFNLTPTSDDWIQVEV